MRAGSRLGPVAIKPSNTQLGHLKLTAGNWVVFARAIVHNTSTSAITHRPVSCRLSVLT